MATRIFLPSSGAIPSGLSNPTNDTWTETTGFVRRGASTSRTSTAMTDKTQARTASAANNTWLDTQYSIGPLAGQTYAVSTIKGTIRALESAANDNVDAMRLSVRVCAPNGTTFRGTIYGPTNGTVAELNTTLRAKRLAVGGATTQVVITEGDYLVIEIGATATTGGVSISTTINYGDNSATDLGDNETDTAANNPFIELAGNMKFLQRGFGQAQAYIDPLIETQSKSGTTVQTITFTNPLETDLFVSTVLPASGAPNVTHNKTTETYNVDAASNIVLESWRIKDTGGASVVFTLDTSGVAFVWIMTRYRAGEGKVYGFTGSIGGNSASTTTPTTVPQAYVNFGQNLFVGAIGTLSTATNTPTAPYRESTEVAITSPSNIDLSAQYDGSVTATKALSGTITSAQATSQTVMAFVKSTRTSQFAQAQADIKATNNGVAQAQATIRGNKFGQAQAFIYIPLFGNGQAQALMSVPRRWAQAQALINSTIKVPVAQANADIKKTTNVSAQALAQISQSKQTGQAQATIATPGRAIGFAQGYVAATYTSITDTFTRNTSSIQPISNLGTNDVGDTYVKATALTPGDFVDGSALVLGPNGFGADVSLIKTVLPNQSEFSVEFRTAEFSGATSTASTFAFYPNTSTGLVAQISIATGGTSPMTVSASVANGPTSVSQTSIDRYNAGDIWVAKVKFLRAKNYHTIWIKTWPKNGIEPEWMASIVGLADNYSAGYFRFQHTAQFTSNWMALDNLESHNAPQVQSAQAQAFIAYTRIVDTYTRSLTDSWGSADTGGTYVLNVGAASSLDVNGTEGTAVIVSGAGQLKIHLPQFALKNTAFRIKFKLDRVPTVATIIFGYLTHRIDSSNDYNPQIQIKTDLTMFIEGDKHVGGSGIGIGSSVNSGLTFAANTYYWFYSEVFQEGSNTRLQVKLWQDGNTEPSDFMYSQVDSEVTLQDVTKGIEFSIFAASGSEPTTLVTVDNLNVGWSAWQFAQAQAKIAGTGTTTQSGQAQADIKAKGNQSAQAQADIKATGFQFAQAQAGIKVTTNQFAQSQADIKATINQFAQTNADIKAVSTVYYTPYGQANADIKAVSTVYYTPYAQAQADIKATNRQFAQAQATIRGNQFGQAQADIKATNNQFGQAQATIRGNQFGQAQADIKAVGYGFGQAQADIKATGFGFAQAQADIKATGFAFAQANADIKATSTVFAQAQADIKQTSRQFAQAQADIKATTNAFAQAQATIRGNAFAQAQADIKQTYFSFAQAQADIKQTYQQYAQANADIKATSNQFAQAQANIVKTTQQYAQAQADIKATSNQFAQANADIKAIGYGFGQCQADIKTTSNQFAQANADIKATSTAYSSPYAQAQADIKATSNQFAQANADIKAIGQGFAQANADIKVTSNIFAQAQADIKATNNQFAQAQATIQGNAFGQAQADIKAIGYGFGQANADIKAKGFGFGQCQATILTGRVGCGQAQADIKVTSQVYGQSQADIKATSRGFAQAQATIQGNKFAQAQADIKTTSQQYGQSQADIKAKGNSFAQANADIKAKSNAFAQANADIEATSNRFAQAQATIQGNQFAQANADIKATGRNYGQAQGDIRATYNSYGQAQASIRVTNQVYAQAQAVIVQSYQQFSQAQALIKATTNAFGQTQANILQTVIRSGNAQADIKATVNNYGQSQAYIQLNVYRFAQAQASIQNGHQQFAQAQGYIQLTGQVQVAQAQALVQKSAGYGQAQAFVAREHTLKKVKNVTDRSPFNVVLSDRRHDPTIWDQAEFNLNVDNTQPSFSVDITDRRGLNMTISDRAQG